MAAGLIAVWDVGGNEHLHHDRPALFLPGHPRGCLVRAELLACALLARGDFDYDFDRGDDGTVIPYKGRKQWTSNN